MSKVKNTAAFADIALFIMAFIWGSGFVVTKNTLSNMSGIELIAVRFLIASVILFFINIKKLKNIKKSTLGKGALLGVILFLGFVFQTTGLTVSSAGKSGFLTSVYVVFVPLFMLIITRHKPDKYNVMAAFIILAGIFMLTVNFDSGISFESTDLLTIIGSLFFGIHVALVGIFTKQDDPVMLTFLQMVAGSIFAFGYLFISGGIPFEIPTQAVPSLLYLGIVGSAITFLIQNIAQKYTSPTHAGIIMSMESVFATILGIALLGEEFTPMMIVGAALIFIALIIAETKLSFLKNDEGEDEDDTFNYEEVKETT